VETLNREIGDGAAEDNQGTPGGNDKPGHQLVCVDGEQEKTSNNEAGDARHDQAGTRYKADSIPLFQLLKKLH
jgi:hypothetical protein